MKVEEQYERLPRTDERIEGQTYFDATGVRQALGVSFASVNRWENGKFEPSIKVKRKIVELCKENNINVEDK